MQGTKGHPDEFPYDAVNPQTGKKMTFDSIDDVYKVLFQCYDECINKGYNKLGEALYQESLFFVNDEKLIDKDCQIRIREHQFCSQFNCPPYPSLKETPASVVDDFMIIQQEIKQYSTKENNGR